MGRKSREAGAKAREEERDVSSYYRLNTQAIEDLVGATIENSPKVSEKELRKYRSGPQIHLGDWMKAALIKWWFHGAVCFFFFWGLGMMVPSGENLMLILGMAMGFVTDLMVNSIFRYYAKTPGANDRWMMFGKKGFASLPKNIVYGYVILACVIGTYSGINGIAAAATGNRESVALGVEPILFGLFATGWDFLFLGIRSVVKRAIAEASDRGSGAIAEAGQAERSGTRVCREEREAGEAERGEREERSGEREAGEAERGESRAGQAKRSGTE